MTLGEKLFFYIFDLICKWEAKPTEAIYWELLDSLRQWEHHKHHNAHLLANMLTFEAASLINDVSFHTFEKRKRLLKIGRIIKLEGDRYQVLACHRENVSDVKVILRKLVMALDRLPQFLVTGKS